MAERLQEIQSASGFIRPEDGPRPGTKEIHVVYGGGDTASFTREPTEEGWRVTANLPHPTEAECYPDGNGLPTSLTLPASTETLYYTKNPVGATVEVEVEWRFVSDNRDQEPPSISPVGHTVVVYEAPIILLYPPAEVLA